MTMTEKYLRDGKWMTKEEYKQWEKKNPNYWSTGGSSRTRVNIMSDANFQMWHPIDKKIFTDKAKFRAHTKAHGYREMETGEAERAVSAKPESVWTRDEIRNDLLKTWDQLSSRK